MGLRMVREVPEERVIHIDWECIGHSYVTICNECGRENISDHTCYIVWCRYCNSHDVEIVQDLNRPVWRKVK